MPAAITMIGVSKKFGATKALDGIDLTIERGSVYGLLGPNGAGKTTAIRILATLVKPTSGTATVLGHDVKTESRAVRSAISLTGQFASVDEELTGFENLVLVGRLLGLKRKAAKERAMDLLAAFGLTDAAHRMVNTYSGGMRRRLDIATSLVVTPQILFLDEPTTGLDPRSRNQVWDIVRAIAKTGTTVLLTTQNLEEADRLADRLAVLDHGKIIAEGTSHELKAAVGGNQLHVRLRHRKDTHRATELLTKHLKTQITNGSDAADLTATVDPTRVTRAINALGRADIDVAQYSLGAPSLDEVFFALTGRPTDDAAQGTNESEGSGKTPKGRKARGNGESDNDPKPPQMEVPA